MYPSDASAPVTTLTWAPPFVSIPPPLVTLQKNFLREAALQDVTISTNYQLYLARYFGKKRRQYSPETGS